MLNYGIKVLSVIGATMLLSLNIAQIYEEIKYYKQKDFYKDYKDYSHVHFLTQEDTTDLENDFIKRYEEEEFLFSLIDSELKNKPKICCYKNNAAILCQNHRLERLSEWMANPVILYIISSDKNIYNFNELLVHATKKEVEQFLQEKQYKDNYLVENVWDIYQYNMRKVSKLIFLNTILLVLIIFLEELINTVILRMEYQIHALKHATQKILGYTIFERNQKMIIGTLLTNGIAIITAMVLSLILHYGHILFILLGNFIFLFCDILLIYRFICHYEKQNLVKILKGGCL